MSKLILPDAPADQTGPVKAWISPMTIPTYRPHAPEPHAMFFERRVYQGSSGKVYPVPFTSRIADEKVNVAWQAVHLENQYLRVMILPELGGRIHLARDKSNGYDLVYRQDVIKPALVNLAGPWISGGIEFNWPQHHRPSTFMPTDVQIEREPDGAVTVWCSEHEPMNRMMGTHGVRLRPGCSAIELRVRLYNRTDLTQTFLWWANVATEVHELYEAFFPQDVHSIADHAKRATSAFPHCRNKYYGIDYATRARDGVPESERPAQFPPRLDRYQADDLRWYANIPVPTSYMCLGSKADFFGGYDHTARAGIVHVANHHISPGKKLWTWGNHDFGYAWDRNLTDADEHGVYRPYIELMAGVYTDNQPDFSFLAPGETKTFSQFWYPIREIGPAVQANEHLAISLHAWNNTLTVGLVCTSRFNGARVRLSGPTDQTLLDTTVDLSPDRPTHLTCAVADASRCGVHITVHAADGREILAYQPESPELEHTPAQPATEPPAPRDIASVDELYLTGLHLHQYRHATRAPEVYWQEALRRDPTDSRCNMMLGGWHLRRGDFERAVQHLRIATASLTRRNPNPRDGEALYLLGVALIHLGHLDPAYDALFKATWNAAWKSPSYFMLARLDCRRGRWTDALEHLDRALSVNADHLQARNLKAIILRRLGRDVEATKLLDATLSLNPAAHMARCLLGQPVDLDTQTRLDLGWELWHSGLNDQAISLLTDGKASATTPMLCYTLAAFHQWNNDADSAAHCRRIARSADWACCFPSRLEEIAVLQSAMDADPADARAPFYLGNLLYDRRRYEPAIKLWEDSVGMDPSFAPAWRNLGLARFNIQNDVRGALDAYQRAVTLAPADGRLLYERDQLWKRTARPPQQRLEALAPQHDLVWSRDDLSVELASLYNFVSQPLAAAKVLDSRRFQPWEGGEGQALGQYTRTCLKQGQAALTAGDANQAARHFSAALAVPHNLGEVRHLLSNTSDIHYWLGRALTVSGNTAAARHHHGLAAAARGDFQDMAVQTYSEMTLYSALSLRALGQMDEAGALLEQLRDYAQSLSKQPAKIDYFATSLPNLLLFTEDASVRQREQAQFLLAQSSLGLGESRAARQLLEEILSHNPNHALAADLLEVLELFCDG